MPKRGSLGIAVERHGRIDAQRTERRHVAQADAGADLDVGEIREPISVETVPASTNGTMPIVSVTAMRISTEVSKKDRPPIGWPFEVLGADALIGIAAHRSAAAGIEAPVGRNVLQPGADDRADGDALGQRRTFAAVSSD